MNTGLTSRELIAFLVDRLSLYAPHPLPREITRAVEIADAVVTDPDFEPEPLEDGGEDEPSLGWTETKASAWGFWGSECGGLQDLEDEHDGREPSEDNEPSLGWCSNGWLGGDSDLEDQHDGREPEQFV